MLDVHVSTEPIADVRGGHYEFAVIGGGPAGVSAAATLAKFADPGEIVIVSPQIGGKIRRAGEIDDLAGVRVTGPEYASLLEDHVTRLGVVWIKDLMSGITRLGDGTLSVDMGGGDSITCCAVVVARGSPPRKVRLAGGELDSDDVWVGTCVHCEAGWLPGKTVAAYICDDHLSDDQTLEIDAMVDRAGEAYLIVHSHAVERWETEFAGRANVQVVDARHVNSVKPKDTSLFDGHGVELDTVHGIIELDRFYLLSGSGELDRWDRLPGVFIAGDGNPDNPHKKLAVALGDGQAKAFEAARHAKKMAG